MRKNKKQHYVPQYYLRNFSENNTIKVYDVKTKKYFSNSINNIAYKNYYYNINPDFFNKIILDEEIKKEDFVDDIIRIYNEGFLAPFINSFNLTAQRLIDGDRRTTISIIDIYSLVDFALVQIYRNPKMSAFYKIIEREVLKKSPNFKDSDKLMRGIVILLLFDNLYYGRKIKFNEEIVEIFKPIIEEFISMREIINNSYKIIYHNRTKENFLTSDFPIGVVREDTSHIFSVMTIPINTKIGVMCINKDYNHELMNEKEKGSIVDITDENINLLHLFNLSTINMANRFIYSSDGIFHKEINSLYYKEFWNLD